MFFSRCIRNKPFKPLLIKGCYSISVAPGQGSGLNGLQDFLHSSPEHNQ